MEILIYIAVAVLALGIGILLANTILRKALLKKSEQPFLTIQKNE